MLRFIKGIPSASKSNFEFKMMYSFEKRKSESEKVKMTPECADKIPVIIERADKSTIQELPKTKYLINKDVTVAQLIYILRRNIKLQPYEAMFLFINDTIPATGAKMSTIYDKYVDKDGFLYITYCGENTFG